MTVGEIAIRVRSLSPRDSLVKAAEAVRVSGCDAVPVAEHGRMVGILTARSLTDFLAGQLALGNSPTAEWLRVDSVRLDPVIAIPAGTSPRDALLFLQTNGLDAAPVLDHSGGLIGLVTSAELAGLICGRGRLPTIGGMATPFGVYLTGGGARGGVGDLALVSAGVYMSLIAVVASLAAEGVLRLAPDWLAHLPAVAAWWRMHVGQISTPVTVLLFCLLFRISGISGFHAAEHQVVHAIESGDDLSEAAVASKPRVHPRCGTNLTVAALLIGFFWYNDTLRGAEWGGLGMMIGLLSTLFSWRRLGALVQQFVTTRPASRRQLRSGIRAAEQLIRNYRRGPSTSLSAWRRIWNMGITQVAAGYMLVVGIVVLLQVLHLLPEWLEVL